MELHQARIFLAVADELHFGRAAARLKLAQPPVTRAIQQLERDLGARLFERSTRSVRLTAAGHALVQPAREMLELAARARAVVDAAGRGEIGTVRVAFAGASTHLIVGRLAREVQSEHPGIDVQLSSSLYGPPVLERVARGEVEIGLGRWDFIPDGVASRVLTIERMEVALPRRHPLASRSEVSMAELRDERFVTLPPGGSLLVGRLHELANAAGFVPHVAQVAPDSLTLVALVGAGIGCSLTLSSVRSGIGAADVVFARLREATEPVLLRIAWRADDDNPALREVLSIADRLFPSPSIDTQIESI